MLIVYCIAISWETRESDGISKDQLEMMTNNDTSRNSGEAPSDRPPSSSQAIHPGDDADRDHGGRTGWHDVFLHKNVTPVGENNMEV